MTIKNIKFGVENPDIVKIQFYFSLKITLPTTLTDKDTSMLWCYTLLGLKMSVSIRSILNS